MRKQRYHYAVSGYHFAPESFHIMKGLSARSLTLVPLTDDQRGQIGYLLITQGFRAAVDQVKRIERERARKPTRVLTYGFHTQDDGYFYCPQLHCQPEAPLAERIIVFRSVRETIAERGCQVLQTKSCELDGHYRPINVKENYAVADLDSPLMVWLKLI